MSNQFLVMTSLEEFWDISKPLVFLGGWCLLHERRLYWEPLGGRLMDGPFQGHNDVHDTYSHVDKLYELILPLLAEVLNNLHNKSHSIRYWRIVLGPWLQVYLAVVYDRFQHIMYALSECPDLTTTVLAQSSFVVPVDTLDFQCNVSEDLYNLQIYSKILLFLGKKFPSKDFQIKPTPLYMKLTEGSWKRNLASKFTACYRLVAFNFFPTSIVFQDSYFPRKKEFRFFFSFFGKALLGRGLGKNSVESGYYDCDMRETIKTVSYGSDCFSNCLASMLFSDLPKCFVESYQSICEIGQKKYPTSTKVIFSANAWYYNEVFKYWAATRAEEGVLLLGTPHGGNYGALMNMPAVKHETSIVDYYYSWGWEREGHFAKVIPMPATKLMGTNKIGANNMKNGILFATTSSPRYLVTPFLLPSLFQDYIQWIKRFAEALPSDILTELSVRSHYQDYGWDLIQRLKESIPDLKLDSWGVPFSKRLNKCRLYVCDHPSTTFAEALASNKPTILFWDPKANQLRPEADHYFNLLRNNGILFDSPEAAAKAVRNAYLDVEIWWNDPDRQNAVSIFCEKYCRTSPKALDLWIKELQKVVNGD